jgi:hypothetical protein
MNEDRVPQQHVKNVPPVRMLMTQEQKHQVIAKYVQ